MFIHSIRTNILTIFFLLIGLVSIALLSSQYYFNQKIASDSTAKTFQLITKNISAHINNNNKSIQNILLSNRENSNLYQKITFDAHHQSFKDITQIMNLHKGVTAIYFAQEDGSFYEIIDMKESTFLFNTLKAPKETKWTVLININNQTLYSFLNIDTELISSYSIEKNYAPKERLWYKRAIASPQPIMTQPYKFSNLNESGITYALQLDNRGTVLAIDYTLEKLHTFLKLQKFEKESEVFFI